MQTSKLSTRELNQIFNNLPFSIAYLDRDYRIIYGNKAYWNLIEIPEENIIGKPCYETVGEYACVPGKTGKDKICSFCKIEDVVRSNKPAVIERPLGNKFVKVTSIPEMDDSGSIYRFLEVIEDITELKQAEVILRKAHDALEQKVGERTFELSLSNEELEHEIAERVRVEETLRENNTMLQTLIHAIPDMVFFKDAEGLFLMGNKAMEESMGLKQEDFVGKSDDELSPPDVAEACKRSDAEAIKRGKPTQSEENYTDKNGEIRFLDVIKAPTYDGRGNITGLVVVGRDITDRVEVERRLQESEDKFRSIFEQAIDGIMIADPAQKRNIEANRAICAMLGYNRDELVTLRVEDIHPKEALPRILDLFEQQVRGEISLAPDVPMLRKDGSILYVDVNSTSVILGGKKCLIGIFRDITERKKADKKLQKSELRLRESQEVARLGSWNSDEVNNTLDWSDETFRLFDKDPATFTTSVEYFVGRIHPDDRVTVKKAIQDTLQNNTPYHVQPRIINETGREWVMEAFGRVERDSNGKPLRIAGTAQDITERKMAEEHIQQSLREKETLLRELYHRTKNNMQVINSLLDLQFSGIDDKKTLQMLEDTKSRIYSMALVHEKLYMANNLSQVYLGDYIKDLADALMESHNTYREQISLHVDVDRIPVSIDTITPLGLVINELMTNALKYAFPNDKKGEIIIKARLNEAGIIELSFSDNGIGMPKGIDVTTVESLGLKITRTLVELQMKGNLKIITQNGTMFIIKFKDKGIPIGI